MQNLSELTNIVAKNSRVWVVWPRTCLGGQVEKIVQCCLSLNCHITILRDFLPKNKPAKDLLGVKVSSVYEFLDSNQEGNIQKYAYDLASSWFHAHLVDQLLVWNGIKLGEMLVRVLPTFSLIDAIRVVEGVWRWLQKDRPDVVLVGNGRGRLSVAVQRVMQRDGIPFTTIRKGMVQGYLTSMMEEVKFHMQYRSIDLWDFVIRTLWAKLMWLHSRFLSQRGDDKERPLAIIIGFGNSHYKHTLPVADELRRRHWRVSVLRGLTSTTLSGGEGIMHGGFSIGTVDGYVTAKIWSHFRRARRQIRRVWKRLDLEGVLENLFFYHEVNLWPLVRPHLRHCFYSYLPIAACYVELTQRIMDTESPAIFVFGDDSIPRAHGMIAAARQRGIPTVVMQHGIPAYPWAYVPYSDKMVVWGEHSLDILVESGASKEKLISIGAPGLDPLKSIASDEILFSQRRLAACRRLGIEERKDLILLLTGNEPEYSSVLLAYITFQAIKDLSLQDRFVVKLHPNEKGRIFRKVASELKVRFLMTQETDLWGLLAASSVVITSLNSTAGVEALILRKPVIGVKTREPWSIYSKTTGLIYEVETKEDLEVRLQQLLDKKTEPSVQSLEWFVGPLDGFSATRVADFLQQLR